MKRVAAYCRVSTDKDDQINSLENQKQYFQDYIKRNDGWEYVGIYIDEGISGTSITKRSGFKKMIADAEAKSFDLLVTKEISRFARNTLDSIYYTRRLKSYGVGVVFMNDGINTLDSDSELRLAIMSSIAQEESRKTSERVKWGQKRSMERGVVFGTAAYGYCISDGKLCINEEEAKIVRLIFGLYLDKGLGVHSIAKEFQKIGIKSPSGRSEWTKASLLRILKNEKYAGTLKHRKEITIDYLSHTRKRNEGEEEFIIIENNHEPIIDKDKFEAVQEELLKRNMYVRGKSKYSNRYLWSGKLECGICASKLKRKQWSRGRIVWICSGKIRSQNIKPGEKQGCSLKAVYEESLQAAFLGALKAQGISMENVLGNMDSILIEIMENRKCKKENMEIVKQVERIMNKKDRLIDIYSEGILEIQEFKKRNDEYNHKIQSLKKQLEVQQIDNVEVVKGKTGLEEAKKSIVRIARLEAFDEDICKELLHKIVVYSRENIAVRLIGNR